MKELEDYDWFPSVFRNEQTRFIGFVVSAFGVYKSFIKHLQANKPKFKDMVDLCSGSGEPAISIFKQSKVFESLLLTDKFPPTISGEAHISYHPKPLDVCHFSFEQEKTYTMFNAFHHFTSQEKVNIISKIKEKKSEAYFVEILEPGLLCYLKVLLAGTLGVLLLIPFIKPFRWTSILFTYIVPLNPLFISWDGMVSVLRSQTMEELQTELHAKENNIEIFKSGNRLAPLLVIHVCAF